MKLSSMLPGLKLYNVIDAVYNLTVSYYLFGQKYMFHNEEALHLMECDISYLHKRENYQLETCINELLVAYNLYHYFYDHQRPIENNNLLHTICGTSFSPQSQGFFFKCYLIPHVIKYLSISPTLADHP